MRSSAALFYALSIVIGGVLFFTWAWPLRERAVSGKNDFLQLYAGARLVGTPDLYSIEASRRIHREITGTYYPSVYYTRLPFYAWLLSPLGGLPYRGAYLVFQAISLAAVAGFLGLYLPRFRELALLAAVSVPLLTNYVNGQDAGLVMAAAGVAAWMARRGRDFTAGLLLSLCLVKFHLFVPVPLVVLIHRRWRMLVGGAAGTGVLMLVSFAVAGMDWPLRFLAMIGNPELHPGPEHMPTLRGLVFALTGENRALEIALGVPVVALVAWLASRIRSFDTALGLSLAGGLLVGHHAYMQDCLMVLLAMVLFTLEPASRLLRGVAAVAVLPPAYFMLLHGVPWNLAVPLLLLSILLAAAIGDAHGFENRAAAGRRAS